MIQQISVFLENKKGRLAFITKVLAQAGADIRAMSVADTSDFGILRLIVDNPEKAIAALKDEGMAVSLTDVLAIGVEDTPGGLAKATNALWDSGISVE
ncbi:MAG: ACT domain-containing protein, partial [Acutalibacteraceae bacterium]